ncbi:hypothetical protein BAL199_09258 [alpha proteobacterium BAL199]|nr:hypothetical protein BAL199_09258 [alpha proteobacterium BAL199]
MLKGGETQMVHAPAKVFSVERRGQQIGAAAVVPSVPLPTSEIMDELRGCCHVNVPEVAGSMIRA